MLPLSPLLSFRHRKDSKQAESELLKEVLRSQAERTIATSVFETTGWGNAQKMAGLDFVQKNGSHYIQSKL